MWFLVTAVGLILFMIIMANSGPGELASLGKVILSFILMCVFIWLAITLVI